MGILLRLLTETPAEKLTNNASAKMPGKVYEVDYDLLKHRCYWNQPLPEDFHLSLWEKNLEDKIRGKDHRKEIVGKARGHPRYPPRCPLSGPPTSSLPSCPPRNSLPSCSTKISLQRCSPRSRPKGHEHPFRNFQESIYFPMRITMTVFNGPCGSTVLRLGRVQGRLNTWWVWLLSETLAWWIDMLCTTDDQQWLQNMLVAKSPLDDQLRAEAPINGESWAHVHIENKPWAEAQPSWKVDYRLVSRLFHFSFGFVDLFVDLQMAILRLQ